MRRFQADDTAVVGRKPDRPAQVASDTERRQAGRRRRGLSPARAAGAALEIPRVARAPEDEVVGLPPEREVRQVRLGERDAARLDQPRDHHCVALGHVVGEQARAPCRPDPRGVERVLDRERDAVKRRHVVAARQRRLRVAGPLLHAGHRGDERVHPRVQLLGSLDQGANDLDRRELAGADSRRQVGRSQIGDLVVHGRSLARRQAIERTSLPKWSPASMRSCAAAASASGRTLSITGAHVPSSTARRSAAKSFALPMVVPRIENWPK